jgi:hypothetical protein
MALFLKEKDKDQAHLVVTRVGGDYFTACGLDEPWKKPNVIYSISNLDPRNRRQIVEGEPGRPNSVKFVEDPTFLGEVEPLRVASLPKNTCKTCAALIAEARQLNNLPD